MRRDGLGHSDGFGVSVLLLLIVGLFAVFRREKYRGLLRVEWVFAIVTLASYFLAWGFTALPHRYLVPLAPLLAMLFLTSIRQLSGTDGRLPKVLTLFLVAITLHTSFAASMTGVHRIPPPTNQAEKQLWLERALPYYRAVQAVNEAARPSDRTYLLLASRTHFYVDTVRFGDWFGHYSYKWLFEGVESDQAMLAKLRDAGFQYLLVDHLNVRRLRRLYPQALRDSAFRAPGGQPDGVRQIYLGRRYSVFKLD